MHGMASSPTLGHDDVEGIDVDRVGKWFTENITGIRAPVPLRAHRRGPLEPDLPGDRRRRPSFALRRPPLSHVLPTAHDMTREYRVISALGPTAVPVPLHLRSVRGRAA